MVSRQRPRSREDLCHVHVGLSDGQWDAHSHGVPSEVVQVCVSRHIPGKILVWALIKDYRCSG